MCWKQEWACAVNNIAWVIIHIKRAELKLRRRRLRNEKYLLYLHKNKAKSSPKLVACANELLRKNREGEHKCEIAIGVLESVQSELKKMIKTYGISRTSNPRETRKLMAGRRKVEGKIKEWVDRH